MKLRDIKLNPLLILGSALSMCMFFNACSSDDDTTPTPSDPDDTEETDTTKEVDMPEEPNKTSGFLVRGLIDRETTVVKYFEEIPTGTIDISDGKPFSTFLTRGIQDNAIFTVATDGGDFYAKHVINAEGEITEVGTLPRPRNDNRLRIKDSEVGVFYNGEGTSTLTVFNPTTFEETGTIDMSDGFVPGDVNYQYSLFGFHGDTFYGAIRGPQGTPFTSLILHQADLTTNTFIGSTQREGDGSSTIQTIFVENSTDGTEDLYIADGGNFSGSGVAARVNKIPLGSTEIDPNYIFEPSRILNPTPLNFLPSINAFYSLGNDRALAIVNRDFPDAALAIVQAAGGPQNLTETQSTEVRNLLFTEETAVWCVLDLAALTVTPIDGIPQVGILSDGQTFKYDGGIYISVSTTVESAYYKWDPTTGVASKAFVVTGVDANSVNTFNIADNY